MPLIIVIALLSALKYFEFGPVANLSWWWIVGLMGVAFLWFEFLEKIFGLDKRKAHDENEKTRQERVKQAFDQNNKSRKR
jgi:small Trp-rich protein